MESDLQITLKGLPDELANNVGNAVASIVKVFEQSDPPLDFRRMHRIIITSDFAGELAALSSTTVSGNPITHTNEEYAQAVAKVLLLPHGESCEILPVINAHVASVLTKAEKNSADFAYVVHLLHHELCHVHDDNKKLDAFPTILLRHKYSGKDIFLGPLTEGCWSEYIADFLSSSTATKDSVSSMAGNFIDALKRTKETIDLEILRYHSHGDLNLLLSIFKRHGEFLPISAAYLLGYIDGLKRPLEYISVEAATSLSGSYFEPIWLEMQKVLQELRQTYPDGWKDFNVFNPLATVLENYYSVMGFNLSTAEDGRAYVDIPMRPETNPLLNLSKLLN